MARVLITGSTTGLGEGAARELLDGGHEVVLHARNAARAASIDGLAHRATGVVVGELGSVDAVRSIADQVNAIGDIDAVIHNAGIYTDGQRAQILAVNVVAPYLLTALVPSSRLVYLSSGMHRSGNPSAAAIDLTADGRDATQAYCDSKLYVTALAMTLAARWPDVLVNAVDPGWVPTRMGGAGAPDDLELGHRTQTWLAVGDAPEALTSGGYWHHQQREAPAPATVDPAFQSALLRSLRAVTGVDVLTARA